ncbi:mediator of RNA polymerase II transcription subunit 1-domain-containing protein [Boeremia exigua]|uniref:mediator of RNA polymerase II transcription subunit 1-domain-containing protein n=1 Tax=Boeremia exigua TaxID=749465 RepID=UPI001E8EE4A2|nr:mediator of RNA polymerase II transcription subunit 1-domain-containing protein [Boeremia exigua]KAH6633289.1 mediator of RNA polymerase II transcription subunit 1-domain-containing protein [Boeremia exigua]
MMATPTPSTNTPQKHLPAFSSPAPRSVPHTGTTAGIMNYDSPAMLHMLNEGGGGLGGVSMGGVNMDISLSQLGMPSASAMGRADEAERTRRLHNIIETLKQKPGRVSEQNVLALCTRLDIHFQKEGNVYILAVGESNLLEILFRGDEVEKIELQGGFDMHNDSIGFGETGTKILTRTLQPLPGQSKMNVTLERFAENLEKLVTLDKLGSPQHGGVSCYNAIAGVYTSLRKLFEHEKKMALAILEEDTPNRNHKAEREVLCKKSGRPRPNTGNRLGLNLEYWMDRRHMIPKSQTKAPSSEKGKEKMEIDSHEQSEYPEDDDDMKTNQVYSLTLECEASPSALYTPIRVSDSWISDAIEKPTNPDDATSLDNILSNTPSIDWQDPKPTFLEPPASTGEDDAMNLDTAPGRLPNIRFVAKFNPPLVVPLTTYISLYQSVGVEPPQDFSATTFVGLALRPNELDPGMTGTAGASTHEIRSTRLALVRDESGSEKDRTHELSLYVPKMEYSRRLENLPFAHPKQLVEILPVLRQYAFTTSLLQNSFLETAEQKSTLQPPTLPITPDTKSSDPPLQLDVNLSYTPPAPRLTLHIPHPSSTLPVDSKITSAPRATSPSSISDLLSGLLSDSGPPLLHAPLGVTLDVHANGELVVSEQNITEGRKVGEEDLDKVQEVDARIKRVGKALEVCGDLGVWGEWLRKEVARGGN